MHFLSVVVHVPAVDDMIFVDQQILVLVPVLQTPPYVCTGHGTNT